MEKKYSGETDYAENSLYAERNNPRIGRMIHLMEEVDRHHEQEMLRTKRIREEQDCIDKMLDSMSENLRNNQEEQKINEEFELHIRNQVYRMHGISEDKLEGMEETRRAWYQGAAFALFFLSVSLTVLCGGLHGFDSEICIFMAFYTAIEGALLSGGRKRFRLHDLLAKIVYLLLFPAMMTVFVCFELGFYEYGVLVPVLAVAGLVILVLGVGPYFAYDPYRMGRRNRKKANAYLRDLEKLALKELKTKEKKLEKLERKQERQLIKQEKKQQNRQERVEKKQKRLTAREENRQKRLVAREEGRERRLAAREEKKQQSRKNGELQQEVKTQEEIKHQEVAAKEEELHQTAETEKEMIPKAVEIEMTREAAQQTKEMAEAAQQNAEMEEAVQQTKEMAEEEQTVDTGESIQQTIKEK